MSDDNDEVEKKNHLVVATTAVFILRSAEVCDVSWGWGGGRI